MTKCGSESLRSKFADYHRFLLFFPLTRPSLSKMANLPHDVLGVVMQFLSDDVTTIHSGAAKVSSRWHTAFLEDEQLWTQLMRKRWPATKKRSMKASVFRARVLADRGLSPLKAEQLTEIENCNFEFEFKCPLYAELLKETGEKTASGQPVLFCDVCQSKVYTVVSKKELAERVSEHRCVMFDRRLLDPRGNPKPERFRVAVVAPTLREAIAFNAAAATAAEVSDGGGERYKSEYFSPTMNPLRIECAGGSTATIEFFPFASWIASTAAEGRFDAYVLDQSYEDFFKTDAAALYTSLGIPQQSRQPVVHFAETNSLSAMQKTYREVADNLVPPLVLEFGVLEFNPGEMAPILPEPTIDG